MTAPPSPRQPSTLAGKKLIAAPEPNVPAARPLKARTQGLGGVFHDDQAMTARDRIQAAHIGGAAIQLRRQNGACALT